MTKNEINNTTILVRNFISIGIGVSVLISLIYCIWILNKGFDITDESYYLILSIFPETVNHFVSAQHWITSVFWDLSATLTSFRCLGLIILLFSTFVLCYGVINIFKLFSDDFKLSAFFKMIVYFGGFSSALTYGSIINFSPSYNLICTAFGYLSLGFAFTVCSWVNSQLLNLKLYTRSENFIILAYSLSAGVFIAISFLCKPPAGLANFCLILLLYFLIISNKKAALKQIALLAFGFVFGLFFFIFKNGSIELLLKQLNGGMELLALSSKNIDSVFILPAKNFIQLLVASYLTIKLFFVPFIFAVLFKFYNRKVLLGLCLLSFIILVFWHKLYLGGVPLYIPHQAKTAMGIMFLFLILTFDKKAFSSRILFLYAGLLLLPYCISFGTSNDISNQVVTSMSSWGILISILAFKNRRELSYSYQYMLQSIAFIFFALSTFQILSSGLMNKPYHLDASYQDQVNPVQIGELGEILVDSETKKFITDLDDIINTCQIDESTTTLMFSDVIGIVLPLQSIPMISTWITTKEQADFLFSNGDLDVDAYKEHVLAIRTDDNNKPFLELPKELASYTIDYSKCGTVYYPFRSMQVEIWKRN